MLLSTFELLLIPITPTPGTVAGSDRSILQGYFLNVSNPNSFSLRIRLRFNALTPSLNISNLVSILDRDGNNDFSSLLSDGPNRFRFEFTLDANDTALFILQPDIRSLNPTTNLEVRGFVEIFTVSNFPLPFLPSTNPLLVTPEHRGTFLPSPDAAGAAAAEFDQLIVSLPTSTGAGLLNVDSIVSPELVPIPFQPIPLAQSNLNPTVGSASTSSPPPSATLEQILELMARRIDSIEASFATSNEE
ncbi:MAG: hypothetical protein AAGE59_37765 [Cyanobacteria bacterium P01_F01_bin.86]